MQRNSCNPLIFRLFVLLVAALLHVVYFWMINLSYGPDTTRKGAACRNYRIQALFRSVANKAFIMVISSLFVSCFAHFKHLRTLGSSNFLLSIQESYHSPCSRQSSPSRAHTPVSKWIRFSPFPSADGLFPLDALHFGSCC